MAVATKTKVRAVKKRVKQHASLLPLSLARRKFSAEEVAFANEVFYTARPLSFSWKEQTAYAVLAPQGGEPLGPSALLLKVGESALVVGFHDSGDLARLDERFASLALEIYPVEVQRMLLESLLEPAREKLEHLFAGEVRVEAILPRRIGKLPPYRCRFAIYGDDPHGAGEVPLLLRGVLAMDGDLADRLRERVGAQERAIYRTQERAVPPCRILVGSLALSGREIQELRGGDVLLLENGEEVTQGKRRLLGLAPYAIVGTQSGEAFTVERII